MTRPGDPLVVSTRAPELVAALNRVFLAISGPDGIEVTRPLLDGDRWAIRLRAVDTAVSGLLGRLQRLSAL